MTFGNRKKPKRMAGGLVAIAFVLGVGTLFAVNFVNILTTNFELGPGGSGDENGLTNILDDGTNPSPDWAGIFDGSGNFTGSSGTGAFIKDDVSAGNLIDRNVYSGGPGDKNSDIIADWTWSASSVPAKDDISNTYAYTVTTGGHKLIYVGTEREDASGDSHIDIEFFQNGIGVTGADANGNCLLKQCGFSGTNKDGDLLVNMDFTNGGGFGTLTVRKRDSSQRNNYASVSTLTGEGCANLPNSSNVGECGFNNGGAIDGGPWANFDNHGAIITKLSTNQFTEFGLDVTALGFGIPCFATIQVKTRSSQSFTATLKDFALHTFEPCSATVATRIHAGQPESTLLTAYGADDIQGLSRPSPFTFHDMALVTGVKGNPTPTGSVTFHFFTTGDCTGTPADQSVALSEIIAPTSSAPGVAAAESSPQTKSSGAYSYKAEYTPPPNTAYTGTAIGSCEPLTITIRNSAVNTDIKLGTANGSSVLNTAIDLSSGNVTVVDVATVTGTTGGPDPAGTVTFFRYATANCTGAHVDETKAVDGGSDATDFTATAVSSARTFDATTEAAGAFLCYVASYSGDLNYNSSVAVKVEPLCAFPFVK